MFAIVLFLILVFIFIIGYWLKHSHFVYHDGQVSDHFKGKIFSNYTKDRDPGLIAVLKWMLFEKRTAWPKHSNNKPEDIPPPIVHGNGIRVSMIGHATVLIQTQGLNFITDPVYSERVSPFSFIGPKRVLAPGVKFENLPKIDAILISHNHYDHMDIATLKRIVERDKSLILTPLGNDVILRRHGIKADIAVLDWDQIYKITPKVNIILTPAKHWSSRYGLDKNRALWGGFIIQSPGGNVYFAGDTGYGDGGIFKEIKKQYGTPKIAILPIGAYEPRWFMKTAHLNPEDAVFAFIDLGKPKTLGMHFGVFKLADEAYDGPVQELNAALAKLAPNDKEKFSPMFPGEVLEIKQEITPIQKPVDLCCQA
jgi:L-ascorbate metabolism protein UlaG (beta-lactamase superfamily)